jgi:translation initiation factor 1
MDDDRLVYSTDKGRLCCSCGMPLYECACESMKKSNSQSDGVIKVGREVKGRGGKAVSIIKGVPLNASALKQLSSELKKHCGTGGSVKGSEIIIQGDQRDLLVSLLKEKGYKAKKSGG